jgi:hypothetical protein
MFEKLGKWVKGKFALVLLWLPLLIGETNSTSIDVSGLTGVMTTLIAAILPLLVIVMVFKVFGTVVKSIGEVF